VITLSDVEVTHGARTLLADVTVRITPGDRVALVGNNGTGKTTLLELIAGLRDPDGGEVTRAKGTTVGYLPQEIAEVAGRPVLDEVMAGSPLVALGERVDALTARLADAEGADREAVLAELGPLQARFEQQGGYRLEAEARRILAGLGFAEERMAADVGEMSGGWMMRAVLARLLLARPDVLLLDEPTNHLDLDSITWLEAFLAEHEGAVVVVSHDRAFMNGLVERVVELANATATEYAGDYDAYVEQRELRRAQLEAAAHNQQRRIDQAERFIERFRAKNTIATRVQSKIKQLEKMERIELPREERTLRGFSFPQPPRSGRVVVELDGVAKSYGDVEVYDGLDLVIERGQRIALVGPNGAGKSTLLKIVAGAVPIDAGRRTLGHNVSLAYYAQHTIDTLDLDATVLDEVSRVVDTSTTNPRSLAGAFLFSGDDVDKPVRVLSGGERARVALAKLMAEPANLLCMDEPTNHLDIPARDVVEAALVAFTGTVVLITHDRHLIRAVADTILEVRDGRVTVHVGGYDDYLDRVRRRERRSPAERTGDADGDGRERRDGDREERERRKRREAERRNRLYRATRDLRERLHRVESDLTAAESEVAELNRALADPSVYDDDEHVAELVRRHGQAKDRADTLMREWEELAVRVERATEAAEAELDVSG
jgi:ATP-binding cassette, subfamily F, member 3